MWCLPQKEFCVLEVMSQEKYRKERDTIMKFYRPYVPTGDLLAVLKELLKLAEWV
jgi:hypothetical protein